MLTAVGIVIIALLGVFANLAQILDYIEKRASAVRTKFDRTKGGIRPRPKAKRLVKIANGHANALLESDSFVDLERWNSLYKRIAASSYRGSIVVVRTPIGGVAEALHSALRRQFQLSGYSTRVLTAEELVQNGRPRSRWSSAFGGLQLTVAPSLLEHEFQAIVTANGSLEQGIQALGALAYARKEIIVIFVARSSKAESYGHTHPVRLTVIEYAVEAKAVLGSIKNSLLGTDVSVFEKECAAWIEEDRQHPNRPHSGEDQASALRRFLAKWDSDIRRSIQGTTTEQLISTFIAIGCCSRLPAPESLLLASHVHQKSATDPLKMADELGLSFIVASHGLLKISLRHTIEEIHRALSTHDTNQIAKLMSLLPLGAGDLPPWFIAELDMLLWSALSVQSKQSLSAILRTQLANGGKSELESAFIGTNTLRLNRFFDGAPAQNLASITLRWPLFDRKTYAGFDFSNGEFVNPTLPDSFGPVTAVLALRDDIVVFGSFTGELRFCRRSDAYPEYSERIDDHAIARIVSGRSSNTLLAVSYSGRIHILDTMSHSRLGSAFETHERLRDAALNATENFLFAVSESGRVLRFDIVNRRVEELWSSNGVRLKAIAFMRNGTVCVGTDEGTIIVLTERGEPLREISISERPIRALSVDLESGTVAAVTDAGELCLIDSESWGISKVAVCSEKLWSVAFLGDLDQVVVGGNSGEIHWFDRRTLVRRRITAAHSSWIRALTYRDKTGILWSGGEDQRLVATDTMTGEPIFAKSGTAPRVFAVCAVPSLNGYAVGCGDGRLHLVVTTSDGLISWSCSGHHDQVSCIAVLGTKTLAASGSDDRRIGVWHLDSGGLVGFFEGTQGWIASIGIEENTGDILAGDDNGMLYWLDSSYLQRKGAYQLSDRRLSCMCRVANNTWIVGTDGAELIRITFSPLGMMEESRKTLLSTPIFCLAKTASGIVVAGTGDGHLLILSSDLELLNTHKVSSGPIWSVSAGIAGGADECVAYSCDTGDLGLLNLTRGGTSLLYRQPRPIWTCSFAIEGDAIVCGGEGAELLTVDLNGVLQNRVKLPLVFTGANLTNVRGLNARQKTLVGTSGGRIT